MEHAIRHHLDVELNDDPELQASFAKALAAIFKEFRENWNKIYQELEKLRTRIMKAAKEPTYGLHRKKQMPLFRMFKREIFGEFFWNIVRTQAPMMNKAKAWLKENGRLLEEAI